ERLWQGEASTDLGGHHPVTQDLGLAEVADRTAFTAAFGNICAFATDDGLLLVDTGNQVQAQMNHERVRGWNAERLHTAVYTHGHIDHVFGIATYEEEAAANGWAPPHVVAHELLPARFERYVMTAGYNGVINQRQFQFPKPYWPTEYRYPDELYRDHHTLEVGGETWELHHDKGETDDATWVWNPGRKVLCTGDLFIWASPNCGNPQKVQRYPREWAAGLRKMSSLGAEVLLPGHGFPILGADRIRQALDDTAELLESLVAQTLEMMNAGERLDDIVHAVQAPAHLLDKPYLKPVYDEPEFVVRNLWRLYGGWYDGNPAHLKPAPDAILAAELARLAGGAGVLASRAQQLAAAGDLRLAGHLAEMAAMAAPNDAGVHAARAEVFGQ
ncbi:MAG TPA: alkyl sulfatase dimerization domain-containing protein, partial [Acidimicrobiales bacterium]|nr:alkyl sulfatase dimerization domain-containing protein [Acidimicrobiales bacterium]